MSSSGALRSLLGRSAGLFTGGAWPDRCVVHHGPLRRLPACLRTGPAASFDTLSSVYTGHTMMVHGRGGAQSGQFSVIGPTGAELRKVGISVFFADIRTVSHEIRRWTTELSTLLHMPPGSVRASSFASPKGGGLTAHYDSVPALLIQLSGTKTVRTEKSSVPFPATQYVSGAVPTAEQALDFDGRPPVCGARARAFVLRPGSVLFVPPGTWHESVAGDTSYSVSLVFEWPRYADLIAEAVRRKLARSPSARALTYGLWGAAEHQSVALEELRRAKVEVCALLERTGARELLGMLADSPGGRSFLSPETLLCRNAVLRVPRKRGSRNVLVQFENGTTTGGFEAPSGMLPLLRAIANVKGPFRAVDLARSATEAQMAACLRLLRTLLAYGCICPIPE